MELAPIILFVYNRPDVTRRTLEALSKNVFAAESTLYIFADGAKPNATREQCDAVREVREIVHSQRWCKRVIVYPSECNLGLAEAVIAGVTQIVNAHGKVIVLEDDIITSPYFLKYLNEGLEVYANHQNVYAVNAYMFPIVTDRADTFLSPLGTSTWGWATWAGRWQAFERTPKYKTLIQSNSLLRNRFNLASYNYTDMLNNSNSWGIRWYYSVFARNGLGVFPAKTLCFNIGFGQDATHTKKSMEQDQIYRHPITVKNCYTIDFEMHALLLSHFTKKQSRCHSLRHTISRFLTNQF